MPTLSKLGKHLLLFGAPLVLTLGCDRGATPTTVASLSEEPVLHYRNIESPTAYAGDAACTDCHADAASAYEPHGMARSFHRWTPSVRIEAPTDRPLYNEPTGFSYAVVEVGDTLYQEEYLSGPGGRRLHELRRRIDYVMGSGAVARTYFTEENGRLFQLPLTWYHQQGWDFSPGYELNNARFDRLMPDRCIACHGSYPEPIPFLEGKYAELPPGIGCERCHGPGALHVAERSSGTDPDTTYDNTIVNPKDLPFERRLDVCQQCHVHTPVTVLREGEDAFSYAPSERLDDHVAFFKATGSIDIVSHADRLRQSACFIGSRGTARPLECATCHDPHAPVPDATTQNRPCATCHPSATVASLADHTPAANCVDCHMPQVQERTVPHGSFTDHWIRVIRSSPSRPRESRDGDRPVEPYFDRDRTGPEADVYLAMGEVVYANLASDRLLLRDAAEALDRALGKDTTRGDALFILGVAYQQLEMIPEAIAVLERSLSADANRPQRLHALARALERGGGDPTTVDSLYRRALQLQPALAWIRADYADFLQARGRREDAVREYRAALAERPSHAVAAFNLGTLLMAQGRLSDASDAFVQAVRLNPSLAEALSTLIYVRSRDNVIAGVRTIGSPVGTLPLRQRGASVVRLTVGGAAGNGVLVVNVPPGALVRVVTPDGAAVRTLRDPENATLRWDLLDETGRPIGGGLYRLQVQSQDLGSIGSPIYFGVVHVPTS